MFKRICLLLHHFFFKCGNLTNSTIDIRRSHNGYTSTFSCKYLFDEAVLRDNGTPQFKLTVKSIIIDGEQSEPKNLSVVGW